MSFHPCRTMLLAAAITLGGAAVCGEAEPPKDPAPPVKPEVTKDPAPPVKPKDPPKVDDPRKLPVLEVPVVAAQDWDRFLFDFQGTDPEKQKAAGQVFTDAGNRGYNEMAKFLNSANADIAGRAKAIREEIDKRSWQRYTDMAAMQQKVENAPLDVAGLQELQKAWMAMAMYASQNALRQSGFQQAANVQKTLKSVDQAIKDLANHDQRLKLTTDAQKMERAAIQMDRAHALKTINRDDDVISAVQAALDNAGPDWRGKPGALKLLSETYSRKQDAKNALANALRIIKEHPRSLEVKFAYDTVLEMAMLDSEWDKAVETLKTLYALCPVDEEVNEKLYSTLSALMDDQYQYKHVALLAEWLIATLPRERLNADAPKLAGGANEYVLKDYAKAARFYKMLGDYFPDSVDPKDIQTVLARVQQKADGKFPKETTEAEPGPAGVLAKFLKAIRTRDHKTAATLVPKADAENYGNGADDETLVSALTFADVILKKTDVDEKAGKATFTIDFYEASSLTPTEMKQQALKEDGAWKIQWKEGNDEPEEDAAELTPAPAQGTPPAPAPAQGTPPAPAPAPVAPAPK